MTCDITCHVQLKHPDCGDFRDVLVGRLNLPFVPFVGLELSWSKNGEAYSLRVVHADFSLSSLIWNLILDNVALAWRE